MPWGYSRDNGIDSRKRGSGGQDVEKRGESGGLSVQRTAMVEKREERLREVKRSR